MTDRTTRSIIAILSILVIVCASLAIYFAMSRSTGADKASSPDVEAPTTTDEYWISGPDEVPPNLVLSDERPQFPTLKPLTFSGEGNQIIPVQVTVPSLLTFTCAECKVATDYVNVLTTDIPAVDILQHETNLAVRSFNPADPLLGLDIAATGEWELTITDLNSV